MQKISRKKAGFAGFLVLLAVSIAVACGGQTASVSQEKPRVDSWLPDSSPDSTIPDAGDLGDGNPGDGDPGDAMDMDACVPTPTKKCRDASFIYLGSKCLTKCPLHNLTCDNRFWKGNCTHGCTTDADCQDTGSVGVCGQDLQCYRPCSPGPKPCSRTMYECVGDPGHTYCASSVPNPHLDGGDDAGDLDAGDDGGN